MITRRRLWRVFIGLKAAGDALLAVALFFLAYFVRFEWPMFTAIMPPVKGIPPLSVYIEFLPFYVLVAVFAYITADFYRSEHLDAFDELLAVGRASAIIGILVFAVSSFYRAYDYSRVFVGVLVVMQLGALFLWHRVVAHLHTRYVSRMFGKPRIGILTSAEKIAALRKMFAGNRSVRLYYMSDPRTQYDIIYFVNRHGLSELIVDYPIFDGVLFQQALPDLDYTGVDLRILLNVPVKLSDTIIDASLGIPVIGIRPISLTGTNYFCKRALDITLSIIVLGVLFVPLLFVSLAIVLDSPGHVLFHSRRVGHKRRLFNCLKFRTMVDRAHEQWWQMLQQSERGDKVFKMRSDPRVTRIGRILRRFSIDEIPQFFNILRGEMSIVGPRPQILEEAIFYDQNAKRRLMIIPGITGLWQISGRADLGFEDMIRLDLYYLENWSLGLDLRILFGTFATVLSRKGAY